jgi:hypothetical protein
MDKKRIARELVHLAKSLVAASPGDGVIKFKIGDVVKFGSRRNKWEITNVVIEYSLYDEERNFVGSIKHEDLDRFGEAVDWRPTRRIGIEKKGYGAVDEHIEITKRFGRMEPGTYRIGLVWELYWGKGINTKKPLQRAEPQNLELADAELTDDEGRTALEALNDTLGGVGDEVVSSPYNTDSDEYGVIKRVTRGAQVTVELYGVVAAPRFKLDQETYEPDKGRVVDRKVFRPILSGGEWSWWSGKYYVLHKYKGKPLVRLLD